VIVRASHLHLNDLDLPAQAQPAKLVGSTGRIQVLVEIDRAVQRSKQKIKLLSKLITSLRAPAVGVETSAVILIIINQWVLALVYNQRINGG
jgi:uncharacterized protein involved in cysteine biosynthesis